MLLRSKALFLFNHTFKAALMASVVTFGAISIARVDSLYAASSPIDARNNTPVIANMLQDSVPSIDLDSNNSFGYKIDTEVSNYFSFSTIDEERFNIDGETLYIKQSIYTKLSEDMKLGLSVPFVRHSSGIFDKAIYNFHDVFGMPQNGRTKRNADKILLNAAYNNQNAINIREGQQGIGDIEVFTESHFGLGQALAWRVTLKLPTGSSAKQTGNGAYGIGAGLTSSQPYWFANRSWLKASPISLWYSSSIAYNEEGEQMQAFNQRNLSLAALIGMGYSFSSQWQVKTQLNTHTPHFDSNIRELGWAPLLLSVEALFSSSGNLKAGLRFSEDLRPRVTPDFSLGLTIAYAY
jgi:Protein of unknown function (DUF3187)